MWEAVYKKVQKSFEREILQFKKSTIILESLPLIAFRSFLTLFKSTLEIG